MELKDKNILIVGFGRSGRAAARYCLKRGAWLVITDLNDKTNFKDAMSEFDAHRNRIVYHLGNHDIKDFESADMVLVSPGVPFDLKEIKAARNKGIPVICEMEIAVSQTKAPVIAISGTNGKSTTTTLIGRFIEADGKKVVVAGNIGTPITDLLDEADAAEFVVLEVSSYQLEVTPNLKPSFGVMLNVTPDHLDRYNGMEGYIAAKRILAEQVRPNGYFIYNIDDPLVAEMVSVSKGQNIPFSLNQKLSMGAYLDDNLVVVKLPTAGGVAVNLEGTLLKGRHNLENITASVLTAALAGVSGGAMERVLREFDGLPHRLKLVRTVNGVEFYDDSKGTNVGAVVKSLEGFAKPVVLIMGGLDKGGSYEPLRHLVSKNVKAIVLIGEAKEKIRKELGDLTETVIADSMMDAVKKAFSKSVAGDVVLLSPACASFDMFKDYNQRGDIFTQEVQRL